MTLIFRGRFGAKVEPDNRYCAAAVHDGGRSVSFHQCSKKPTCTEIVNGKEYGFCATHAPSRVKAKREAQDAKRRAEWAAADAARKRANAIAAATARCIDAMAEIRDGHNDPRALASEVLALFPDQPLSRNIPETT